MKYISKTVNVGDYIEIAGSAHDLWFRGRVLKTENYGGTVWFITVATHEHDMVGERHMVYEEDIRSFGGGEPRD